MRNCHCHQEFQFKGKDKTIANAKVTKYQEESTRCKVQKRNVFTSDAMTKKGLQERVVFKIWLETISRILTIESEGRTSQEEGRHSVSSLTKT